MGKSNRIRALNAEKKIANQVKPKSKKHVPAWLTSLIAVAMAVIVLAVCVLGVLSSNGVIMRHRYPVRSENFKISANMMAYYYQTQLQNFESSYESYMSYFSLDKSKSLKDQIYGDEAAGGYEASFLGDFEGTWFDYFMSLATKQAEQILIYCEEAKSRGITLDETDIAEIETTLATLTSTGAILNYSTDAYIAQIYGPGIKLQDIRDALELSLLAEKCATDIQNDLVDGITLADIITKYEADPKGFQLVDYTFYTISVKYTDIATEILGSGYSDSELSEKADEVLAEYSAHIKAAKELSEKLKNAPNPEEFMKLVYPELADTYYDNQYATIKVGADDIPEESVRAEIKTAMIESLLADFNADKEETDTAYVKTDDKYTLYGKEVTEAFATAMNTVKKSCYTSLKTSKSTYNLEKQSFIKDDDLSTWAFDDARKANDTYSIFAGDGKDSDTVTKDTGSFSASTYILKTTKYRDDSLSKNVAYMVFSKEADAKAAIEALGTVSLSLDEFKRIASEKSASTNSVLEEYTEGTLGLDEFDEWLYDDTTTMGSYTKTPINSGDDSAYLVAYYYSDGTENWRISVKSTIFSERFEAYYNDMVETYTITVKDKLLKKIDG